ncbi:glycosyltransferase [Weissella soli]|uniref:glycosyltransferase n=1 Tax=Weissella soli TaxID=155866 RepID=UPI003C792D8B
MSFDTVFVVTEMRLGGRERVVSRVAGSLNQSSRVAVFSVWKRVPFFESSAPIYFDSNHQVTEHSNQLNNKLENKPWMKPLVPIAKRLIPYSLLQRKRVLDLIEFLEQNDVKNVILTDLTSTFAHKIRNRIPDINIISWIHMQPDAFFEIQYKGYKKELMQGFSSINTLVALTPKQASEYKKYVKKTVPIPNPMPNVSKQRANLSEQTVLIVSRIDIEHKGLDYLPKFLAYLPDGWHIKVVGGGNSENEQIFSKIVTNSDNKIIWEPATDGEKLKTYYQSASMFIMPSRFEGFPLTLGEAMSNGLPVVAFDLDGTHTILKDDSIEYGILVPQGDFEKFGEAIEQLASSEALREKLSERSIVRVSDFSESSIMEEWEKILR